jgi:hypothetical protein
MWRRVVVCDKETSKNEEAKARYWAVKIQPQWVVTPGKQQQQQTIRHKNIINYIKAQRLSCFGHLHRMPEERMVKKV